MDHKTYCISCKTMTGNKDSHRFTASNGSNMMRSKCTVCGKSKTTILPGKK